MTRIRKALTLIRKSGPDALHGSCGCRIGNLLVPSRRKTRFLALLARTMAQLAPTLRAALVPILSACISGLFPGSPEPALAQDLDKPSVNIDEDVTAFAFAPDGRVAYSVRRMYRNKKYDMERDDIYLRDTGGRSKRIFQGEKFTVLKPFAPRESDSSGEEVDEKGKKRKKTQEEKDRPITPPFTYLVEGFSFSPNGKLVLVQLLSSTILDDSGHPQDERMTLVLDDSGREIKLSGDNAVIHNSLDAMWLSDGTTMAYLTEAVQPNLLYSFKFANVKTGPAGPAFEGRTFIAAVKIPHSNSAIAIERDRNMSGPPRLQRLELLAQDDKELATLDGYETGLSVSPSGKHVAYFIDKEVLEVRDLESPNRLARVRVGLGAVEWSSDEQHLLIKRSPEHKSGDLVWIALPHLAAPKGSDEIPIIQPDPQPILHGLTFRDFSISPDGRTLGVIPPGKRNLLLFPLPSPGAD